MPDKKPKAKTGPRPQHGIINPRKFERELREFSRQFDGDYIQSEEQRERFVQQVLSYYDDGYGLIDWREVCIFTDGYFMQAPNSPAFDAQKGGSNA